MSVTLDTLAFDSELLDPARDRPAGVAQPVRADRVSRSATSARSCRSRTRSRSAGAGSRKKLPAAETRASHSTSDAAREVSQSKRTDLAAICNALAAELYGLEVLATEIEDHPENQTRFVLVGRGVPAPTGHDKTSIVCFQRQDRPGSLLGILQEFAARAINLTKLESRPTKRGLGDYCFFIDCEGHVADEVVADALRNLVAKQAEREVPRLVSGRRSGRGRCRAAAGGRAARGRTRPRGSRRCARRSGTTRVIDLKRLRDEPEYRRGIERKRVRDGLIDEVLDASTRRASTLRQGGRAIARPSRTRRRRRSGRPRPTSGRRRSTPRATLKAELSRRRRRRCGRSRRELRELALQVPNPADAVGARRRRGRRRRAARPSATRRRRPRSTTPRSPRRSGSSTRPRRRRRVVPGSRTSCARPRCSSSRSSTTRCDDRAEHGFVPVDHARRSSASARWRRPASSRPTAPRCTTSTTASCSCSAPARSPLSALHRGETFTPDAAARALRRATRRASGAKPARTARTRAASSACTSSTRSRCSRSSSPTRRASEHERILAIEEEIVGGLGLPYRVRQHRGRRPRAGRGEEVRHRGVAAVGRRVPRAHVVLELHRLLGPAARHAREGRRRVAVRAHAERHRVRDQPHARVPVRALPGRPTGASTSPTCCGPTPASSASSRAK